MSDPNETFRAKLDGKSRLRILLSDKPKTTVASSSEGQSRHPQMIQSRLRPDDELIVPKKSYVNFWDLGQIKNESDEWVDLDFIFAPNVTINSMTGLVTVAPFSAAQWATIADSILAVPTADWKTYFRKLSYEQAERYGLEVYNDNISNGGTEYPVARNGSRITLNGAAITDTKWTPGGLKLPAPVEPVAFGSYGAFAWMQIGSGAETKVTTSPLYSAPAVTLAGLAKKADVFLMPRVHSWFGSSLDGSFTTQVFLVGPYQVLRRQVFLDMNYTDSGHPAYAVNFAGMRLDAYSPTDRAAIMNLMKHTEPDSYGIQQVGAGVPTHYPAAATDFPTYYGTTGAVSQMQISTVGGVGFMPALTPHVGDFLGAVFQNGTMYYVWATSTREISAGRPIDINNGELP